MHYKTKGKPQVSVVMPLYNKASYVERSVNSVINQSFENFELIIINDGSTDDSEELVKQISDTRIRFYSQENLGVSSARNKALDCSIGEWVAFIDADDEWSPDHLNVLLHLVKENSRSLVVCDEYRGIGSSFIKNLLESSSGVLIDSVMPNTSVVSFDYLHALTSGLFVTSCSSAMVRRSVIEEHGIRFQENMRHGEDLNFWIRLSRYGLFTYCEYPGSIYHRDDPNSGMNRRLLRGELMPNIFYGLARSDFSSEEFCNIKKFITRERIKTAYRNRGAKFNAEEIMSINFHKMTAIDLLYYLAVRYLPIKGLQLAKALYRLK